MVKRFTIRGKEREGKRIIEVINWLTTDRRSAKIANRELNR